MLDHICKTSILNTYKFVCDLRYKHGRNISNIEHSWIYDSGFLPIIIYNLSQPKRLISYSESQVAWYRRIIARYKAPLCSLLLIIKKCKCWT